MQAEYGNGVMPCHECSFGCQIDVRYHQLYCRKRVA
uniref:ZZ-type domain-containing protein n=1 Tax=Arundo donax TaxID=35708 RepID=A0A0A9A464_ARUDO